MRVQSPRSLGIKFAVAREPALWRASGPPNNGEMIQVPTRNEEDLHLAVPLRATAQPDGVLSTSVLAIDCALVESATEHASFTTVCINLLLHLSIHPLVSSSLLTQDESPAGSTPNWSSLPLSLWLGRCGITQLLIFQEEFANQSPQTRILSL